MDVLSFWLGHDKLLLMMLTHDESNPTIHNREFRLNSTWIGGKNSLEITAVCVVSPPQT